LIFSVFYCTTECMRTGNILIAPSVLTADFSRMGQELERVAGHGGDWVHLDVMDGHFVPNISFGPKMVADLRKFSKLPFDVHLMTREPDRFLDSFSEAGADYLTFHLEASLHAHRTAERIRRLGKKAGVSIVPSTPAFMVQELLSTIDLVLVMSVDPGFGGQKMIPECLEKVRYLAKMRKETGKNFLIEVDGGVNRQTAPSVIDAGADVLVLGSAFFSAEDPSAEVAAVKGHQIV